MRLDKGIKELGLHARGKLATMYKRAFKREFSHTGNHRCWITLLETELGGKNRTTYLAKRSFLAFLRALLHSQ